MYFVDRLTKSIFARNFAILATGTIIAQVIPILASPILTRIYSPQDFGVFAIFMAIVSSFTPVLSGKYEVALLLPKDDSEGLDLLGVAFWFCACFSLFFLLVVLFGNQLLDKVFDAEKLGLWIFALPVAFLLTGFFNILTYFSNRSNNYKLISKSRIIRSTVVFIFSVLLGIAGFQSSGFIISFFVGMLFSVFVFLFYGKYSWGLPNIAWNTNKYKSLVKYKDFPLYNATSGFLDGITIAMPIFFMSHYFSETTVGLYALVVRVGNTPLAFISSSVSQINLKKIIDLINTHKNVRLYLFRISFLLLLIVFPFVLVTMLWAPSIFTFFFGNEWYDAGIYLQILVPALGVKFIASTLSSTLGATNNNKLGMIWKIISFVTTIIIFIYFAPKRDILLLLSASMIADIFLYILYYCFIWIAANHPRNYI